jgi:predicted nucleic acid-binding Zn ribbon protein
MMDHGDMPIYEYRCSSCLTTVVDDQPGSARACSCGDNARRVWGFRMAKVMHEHHNATTGTVVSDRRQIKNELRRLSEKASERTGIVHNYVEADLRDTKTLRVTDEGLNTTYDRKVRSGEIEKGKAAWPV